MAGGALGPRPGWGCLVAEDGGRVVGFVGYGPPEEREDGAGVGEVYAIYLDRSAAGWAWDGTTSAHRFDRAELSIVRYAVELPGSV